MMYGCFDFQRKVYRNNGYIHCTDGPLPGFEGVTVSFADFDVGVGQFRL